MEYESTCDISALKADTFKEDGSYMCVYMLCIHVVCARVCVYTCCVCEAMKFSKGERALCLHPKL